MEQKWKTSLSKHHRNTPIRGDKLGAPTLATGYGMKFPKDM